MRGLHKICFGLHLPPLRAHLGYTRVWILAVPLVLSRLGTLCDNYRRDFGIRNRVIIALCIKNASRPDLYVIIVLSLADAGPRWLPLWVILQGIVLLIRTIYALVESDGQLLRLDPCVIIWGSLRLGLGRQGDFLGAILNEVRGLELVLQALTTLLELMEGQGAHTEQIMWIICNWLLPLIHEEVQLLLVLGFLCGLKKHGLFNYVI